MAWRGKSETRECKVCGANYKVGTYALHRKGFYHRSHMRNGPEVPEDSYSGKILASLRKNKRKR